MNGHDERVLPCSIAIRTVVVIAALFLLGAPAAHASQGCDYYAAPTDGSPAGSGSNTGGIDDPITVAKFFEGGAATALAQPGTTLCLADGVYRGSDSMIEIVDFAGDESAPITVRALNDGAVEIDGEATAGGTGNAPVRVLRSHWIVLEGFDAHDSTGNVVTIAGDPREVDGTTGEITQERAPSTDIVLRRVVAWNAYPAWADADEDGVHDALDNCPTVANPPFARDEGYVQPNDDLAEEALDEQYGNACDCDFDNDGDCDAWDSIIFLNDFCVFHPQYDDLIDCTAAPHTRYDDSTDMDGDGDVDWDDGDLNAAAAADGLPGPARIDSTADTGANSMPISVSDSDRVTIEDAAAFGTGRKMVSIYRSTDVTARRVWARWEGNGSRNNRAITCSYRSYGSRCENFLVTSSNLQMPNAAPAPGMLIGTDDLGRAGDEHFAPGGDISVADLTQIGSLAYVDEPLSCTEDPQDQTPGRMSCPDKGFYSLGESRVQTYADGVVYFDPGLTALQPPNAWRLGVIPCADGSAGQSATCPEASRQATVSNMTAWGVANPASHTKWGWIEADIDAPESATAPRPDGSRVFTAENGNGGQLCRRAQWGNAPLWPWPMRDRILAATTNQTRFPTPPSLDPSSWSPRPVDIHATIEGMFGPIPPTCWDDDGDKVADAEDNCSQTPNSSQLDQDGDGFGNACDCDFDNDGDCDAWDSIIFLNDFCVFHPDYDDLIDCTAAPHTRYHESTDMDGDGDVDWDDGDLNAAAAADGLPGPGAVTSP